VLTEGLGAKECLCSKNLVLTEALGAKECPYPDLDDRLAVRQSLTSNCGCLYLHQFQMVITVIRSAHLMVCGLKRSP
jgi:hypothetical protein